MALVNAPRASSSTPQPFKPPQSKSWWKKFLTSGPVAAALDVVTRPAYAVGGVIAGKPRAALSEVAPFIPGIGQIAWLADKKWDSILADRAKILPGQALQKRGLLPGGTIGSILSFGADVALDPTTYVTFGVGGAAKRSLQTAASVALKEVDNLAAKQGRAITHAERAAIEGDLAAKIAAAPKPLEFGLRIPFRRGPNAVKIIGSSVRAGNALRAPFAVVGGTKIGKGVRQIIVPGGTADPVVKRVWRGLSEISQRDKSDLTRRLGQLQRESFKIDKELGQKRGWTAERLTFFFDNPTKHPLPAELSEFATPVNEIREELLKLAIDAKILTPEQALANYIPHLAANKKTVDKLIAEKFITRDKSNPFFTKHRAPGLETLDDWIENGLDPETNVFKLLQLRGHQSIDAMATRAMDDEMLRQFGGKRSLYARPNVGKTAAELAEVQDLLRAASAPALGRGGVRDAARRARQVAAERAAAIATPGVATGALRPIGAASIPYPSAARTGVLAAREQADSLAKDVQALISSPQVDPAAVAKLGEKLGRAKERAFSSPAQTITQRTPSIAGANFMAHTGNAMRDISPYGSTQLVGLTAAQSRAYSMVIDRAQRVRDLLATQSPSRSALVRAGRDLEAARAQVAKLADRHQAQVNVVRRAGSAPTVPQPRASARQTRQAREAFGTYKSPLELAQDELAVARAQAKTGVSAGSAAQVRALTRKEARLKEKLARQQKKYARNTERNEKLLDSPAAFTTPEGWEKIQREWVTLGDELKGRVPPEIAEDMAFVMDEMRRSLDSPAAIYEAGNFLHRIGSNWKSLAILSPGFHMRNSFDDALRGFFAGARNPQSYLYAARIIGNTDGVKNVSVKVDGEMMSIMKLAREAESNGSIDRGIISYEIKDASEFTTRSRWVPRRPGEGTPSRGSRRIGTARENTFRLGTYIDLRRQGYSSVEAAELVKTHHFDYGDVSQFVGRARRFWLPFVTYASKAVPYFGRQLVQRPGQAAGINKAMIELRAASGQDIDTSLLPVGQRLSVPLPGIPFLENDPNTPLLLNPEGVGYFTALNQLDPTQVQRQFVAKMVNPLARSPVEVATGYSFYRGRRTPEIVRAPDWMRALSERGVNVPGYVPTTADKPYRDVLSKEPRPGMRSAYDALYRNLPIYSQADLVTGGAAGDWQFGVTKYLGGLPINRYDRVRAQALADYFAKRGG